MVIIVLHQTDAFLGHFGLPVAFEIWTLTAELERKIQVTEMRCFRRLLGIFYSDLIMNEEVRNTIRHAIEPYEDLITMLENAN